MDNKSLIKQRLKFISDHDLNQLSDEQVTFIINGIDKHCFLSACPGSGKTEVVALKAAYEIASWDANYSGMSVLSFTNNAADEISQRISKYCGVNSLKSTHFVGTIDSWLHKYILQPFAYTFTNFEGKDGDYSHSIIDSKSKSSFILKNPNWRVVPNQKKIPIFVHQYSYDIQGKIIALDSQVSNSINNCTDSEKESLKQKKTNFFKKGYITYSDSEFIIHKLLSGNSILLENLSKRFPVVIVDECQDLSSIQLSIFELLVNKGVKLIFVGDKNQSIYEFRHVDLNVFNSFVEKYSFEKLYLTYNFRSNQKIIDVCQKLIRNTDCKIEGNKNTSDYEPVILWTYTSITELPKKLSDFLESNNISKAKSAILVRSNNLIFKINSIDNTSGKNIVEEFAQCLSIWGKPNISGDEMIFSIRILGRIIAMLFYNFPYNHQQFSCPSSINNIEWRIFIYKLLNIMKGELLPWNDVTWKQWSTKCRTTIKNNIDLFIEGHKDFEDVTKNIKAPSNKGDKCVSDDYKIYSSLNNIRTTTIHNVKGETLDAVLLVSSPKKMTKEGHLTHWITQEGEAARLAYVASSRPKHLLIWAIPEDADKKDIDKIQQQLEIYLESKNNQLSLEFD